MQKKIIKKAKEILEDFFGKFGIDIDVEVVLSEDEQYIKAQIKTSDPYVLIGQQSQTLNDLQQILGKILKQQIGPDSRFSLDINQYKASREKYIKDLVNEVADKIAFEKRDYVLPVMNAFERRVAHTELADRKDVKTESIGQEPQRRVVIRPS